MRPLLSICVPTFQRAEIVYNTVINHLKFEGKEIEVVVSDNGSLDHTVELLNNIRDRRLKIYTNEVNRGFQYNLFNVVKKASGHFVCTMSDQDILDHSELRQVLCWIKEFVEDNYEVGVIISGQSSNIITKKQELMNILYGRASYMSGIILNKDLLDEESFSIKEENYYPHIKLALQCGQKARVVFSPYSLYRQWYQEDEQFVKRMELERKTNKGDCKLSPYIPQSREKQLVVEKNMILELDVSDYTKFCLLTRQYQVKLLQATSIFELLSRSLKALNNLGIAEVPQNIPNNIEYSMSEEYYNTVKEYLNPIHIEQAKIEMERQISSVQCTRINREEYDLLTKINGYKAIMIGKDSYIETYIDNLMEYNFNIDYLCITNMSKKGDCILDINELDKMNKVVLLVDSTDRACIEQLENMNLQEVHLFYVQDLNVMLV